MTDHIRVMHVIGGLNAGGTETWLVKVLGHLMARGVACEVVVHSSAPQEYSADVRRLGVPIHVVPSSCGTVGYAVAFRSLLRARRGVEIVHSHVYDFSGLPLTLAACAGIRGRILHVHTEGRSRRAPQRSIARRIVRTIAVSAASHGVAVGASAGRQYFGTRWGTSGRFRVLECGVDTDALRKPADRVKVRSELGIPVAAPVLGHVGRLVPVKNQAFLLRVLARLRRGLPEARLLLVGDGPERSALEREADRLGVADAVILAGTRRDVPTLLRAAMDVFLLPSHFEGVPLSVIEAQIAGIPCVVSDVVAHEAVLQPECVTLLPIGDAEDLWVRRIRAVLGLEAERPPTCEIRSDLVAHWSLEASAERLLDCYDWVMGRDSRVFRGIQRVRPK